MNSNFKAVLVLFIACVDSDSCFSMDFKEVLNANHARRYECSLLRYLIQHFYTSIPNLRDAPSLKYGYLY